MEVINVLNNAQEAPGAEEQKQKAAEAMAALKGSAAGE